jgi:2-phosphosulfolactate phosphatase
VHLVTSHVDDLPESGSPPDVAVVIDVVRAFTVAPWVLARGADRLLFAASVDAAVAARADHPDALLLTDRTADPRFALPNAPGRIAREDLRGRTVIQVTGNGTRGAFAVGRVPLLLCASFVTAAATARVITQVAPARVLLVPTEGDEDHALADYLVALLDGGRPVDPTPYLDRVVLSPAGRECATRGGEEAWPGFDADDLMRCLEIDAIGAAVRAQPLANGLLAVTSR